MSINIENYIINKIKEIDSTLDTSSGSVFHDFFIKPLSKILEEYNESQETILDIMSISNVDNIPETVLDHIGLFYLEERGSGSKSYGSVYLYFSEAQYVNIPEGTLFKSGDQEFESTVPYIITRTDMDLNNLEGNLYYAGPINVIAVNSSDESNLDANSAFTIKSFSSYTPLKIINKLAFVGGSASETNQEFFERLKQKAHGKSLSSPYVIKKTLTTEFPSISNVEVIGSRSNFMLRDLIVDASDYASSKVFNFYYAKNGSHNGTYDIKHEAYTGNFVDTYLGSGVAIPPITAWTTEFSDEQYRGIYKKDDALFALQERQMVLDSDFSSLLASNTDELVASMLTSGQWSFNDGSNPVDNSLFNIADVGIGDGYFRLGRHTDIFSENENVAVALLELKNYQDMIRNGLQTPESMSKYMELLNSISNWLAEKANNSINNRSPIMHKPVDQHTGINILCEMSTTDDSEEGKTAYITCLRNDQIFLPHDGFGIAWRKQPEYLLRIAANNYTDDALKTSDLSRLKEEYSLNDSEANGCLGNLDNPDYVVKGTSTAKSLIWKMNVYLVDNDVLQTESWIGYDQIWDQASGKNQFLQAGKYWIEPNESYVFDIEIGTALSVQTWIYKNGEERNDATNRVINRGVTYPEYVPVAGYKYVDTETQNYALDATRGHFGIGVSETNNCEWRVYNLKITSITTIFPAQLFKFDINEANNSGDPLNTELPFTVNYYGIAYDSSQPSTDGTSGLELSIYVPSTQTWETVGTVTHLYGTGITDLDNIKITKTFANASNYLVDGSIYIAAISNKDTSNVVSRTLKTYYIELTDYEYSGSHRGNCTDIYCHDPINIASASVTATVSNNEIKLYNISTISPFIQEVVEVREAISKLPYSRDEYIVYNDDLGLSYSKTPKYRIAFSDVDINGTLIEIVYRYWTIGTLVDNLFTGSENRYPCSDQMVKIMPPTVVTIDNLEYSGNINENDLKSIIVSYINNLEDTKFEKSDIVNLLYTSGATYVNLDMDITIREYSHAMDLNIVSLENTQYYSIPSGNLSRFYTHINEITVRKV